MTLTFLMSPKAIVNGHTTKEYAHGFFPFLSFTLFTVLFIALLSHIYVVALLA